MPLDYDLVIVGATVAGFYAAEVAVSLKARVALVIPQTDRNLNLSIKAFSHIGNVAKQFISAEQFGIYCSEIKENKFLENSISWRYKETKQWVKSALSNLEEYKSPALLAALGVDVIVGDGQFCPKPQLCFEVNNRRLFSRSYLLAPATKPITTSKIEGLEAIGYFTPDTIWKIQPPKSLIIIGGEPAGIELAQTFARLGCAVTLVVKSSRILPKEDAEAAFLVQGQLEAEGVRVLTNTEVCQVRKIDGKKWIQAGNLAIEGDEILLAIGRVADVKSLNLESVGVKWGRYIQVNEKLQTSSSRIYACGEAASTYGLEFAGNYQAEVAVKNALFLPIFKVNYAGIPWGMQTDPQLATVGLTEAEAIKEYGEDLLVLRQYFKSFAAAIISGETTGFCKILVRRNGTILGAVVVGENARELIYPLGLARRENIKVGRLAELGGISPAFSEMISNTAAEWGRLRLAGNSRLQDFLEGWFNWRRGTSK
ncbi:NAD(P)/FAD-dependent oxidoreductase [Ancylothrix sp. C2]|uniref:dihydrolipoyl dehydrogenase family protein n=1 Tax=Ancylothrix sp. D3o TaxID=2953691 RepID=UPI0021BBB4A9|nr:NAD(P)/FAD-dependent oxidoreductase [Ancylothrix sp. D3o]MCT7951925.1 NAD(P)/FAD-dependent oxidoreductase [Ancylothrix sp. D3o]